ncbi:hypothetical protein DFP72DRAFT_459545 [Ephemerocybe angulata]|uniref:Uncharacterized protein n=1 Tax=Ephemerocybe angulata TaxID=980116 RepID=A0A8H6HSD0_9AGAR|nr:hypothetical protein DFP72DRAFT_459545 [Tulosesus angulatus]
MGSSLPAPALYPFTRKEVTRPPAAAHSTFAPSPPKTRAPIRVRVRLRPSSPPKTQSTDPLYAMRHTPGPLVPHKIDFRSPPSSTTASVTVTTLVFHPAPDTIPPEHFPRLEISTEQGANATSPNPTSHQSRYTMCAAENRTRRNNTRGRKEDKTKGRVSIEQERPRQPHTSASISGYVGTRTSSHLPAPSLRLPTPNTAHPHPREGAHAPHRTPQHSTGPRIP